MQNILLQENQTTQSLSTSDKKTISTSIGAGCLLDIIDISTYESLLSYRFDSHKESDWDYWTSEIWKADNYRNNLNKILELITPFDYRGVIDKNSTYDQFLEWFSNTIHYQIYSNEKFTNSIIEALNLNVLDTVTEDINQKLGIEIIDEIKAVSYHSPKAYNYFGDWVTTNIKIDLNLTKLAIKKYLKKKQNLEKYVQYLNKTFIASDGYNPFYSSNYTEHLAKIEKTDTDNIVIFINSLFGEKEKSNYSNELYDDVELCDLYDEDCDEYKLFEKLDNLLRAS